MTRILILFIFIFLYVNLNAQEKYWSHTYFIKFNNSEDTNYFPNTISAFEINNDSIFTFFYSSDTTYKNPYGTGFGIFDLNGNLLQYRSIPYKGNYNYHFPEEIISFDYKNFYTSVYLNQYTDAVLKYNYITFESDIYEIRNTVCDSCFIKFSGMAKDPKGFLVAAHTITIPNQKDSFFNKVQVSKLDKNGNKVWTKIVGGESINYNTNYCNSVYIDKQGYYCVGTTYENHLGSYLTIVYKIDSLGNIVKEFKSKLNQQLGSVYDICQKEMGHYYLSSERCDFQLHSLSIGGITQLDKDLNFIKFKVIGSYQYGWQGSLYHEKVNPANDNGIIICYNGYNRFSYTNYDSIKMKFDTIKTSVQKTSLIKVNNDLDSLWHRKYIVREGVIKHWTDAEESMSFDLKSLPNNSGYLLGGQSYRKNALEVLKEPGYMPLLIKVDNYGCIIPGCEKTSKLDNFTNSKMKFTVWPNTFSEQLIVQHNNALPFMYRIVDMQERLMI